MTNINLYQSQEQASGNTKKATFSDSSFVVSIAVLAVTLLAWGGTYAFAKNFENKNTDILNQIKNEGESITLDSKQIDRINDFQKRMEFIGKNIDGAVMLKEELYLISREILPGISLASYSHEEGLITLTLNANDFQTVAAQVQKFKTAEKFTGVSVSNIKREETKINFDIQLSSKK